MPQLVSARPLPADNDAERNLLGSLLVDNAGIPEVLEITRAEHCNGLFHPAVFRAIERLHARGSPVDFALVRSELAQTGELAAVPDGVPRLAALVDGVPRAANAPHYARIVRDKARKRDGYLRLRAILARVRSEELSTDEAADELEVVTAQLRGTDATERLERAIVTGADIYHEAGAPPLAYVGDGLLAANEITILFGAQGTGKTWATMDLVVALTRGAPWLGFPTLQTRVLLVELECSRLRLHERLHKLTGSADGLERLDVLTRANLEGGFRIDEPGAVRRLRRLALDRGVGVVIFDTLSRIHEQDENSAQDMGRVFRALEDLAAAGPAVLAVHHPRKQQQDGKGDSSGYQGMRGSGRLFDAHTILHLTELHGCLAMVTEKRNHGRIPDPIYLERTADGPLVVRPAPADPRGKGKAEDSWRKLSEVLREHQAGFPSQVALAAAAGLSEATVSRHLREGVGRKDPLTGWIRHPDFSPAQPDLSEAGETS